MMGTLIPVMHFNLIDSPLSFEVLDGDALISLIKIKNAFLRATRLMKGIANGAPAAERAAMDIGHMLHEGTTLWTTDQAMESTRSSIGFFGSGERSARLEIEESIVYAMTCPGHHLMAAACAMLETEAMTDFFRSIGYVNHIDGWIDAWAFMNTPDTPAFRPLKEYMKLALVMNEHLHPASECGVTG